MRMRSIATDEVAWSACLLVMTASVAKVADPIEMLSECTETHVGTWNYVGHYMGWISQPPGDYDWTMYAVAMLLLLSMDGMSRRTRYDTIRDAVLTCARKPTWVSLIYRTETTNKKWRTEKLKSKKWICAEVTLNSLGNPWSQSWGRKEG